MITEVQIPDETFRKYGSPEALAKRLEETEDLELQASDARFQLDKAHLATLRHHFGPFRDVTDLIRRILAVGAIRVQDVPYQLTSDQILNLKQQAYGHSLAGEPRDEREAERDNVPKEVIENMINRYLAERVQEAMDVVLGTW